MTEPTKRKKPFSSMAATLKWARDTFGKGSVAQTSWWQGFQGADQEGNPRKGGVRKDAWGFQDCQVLDGLPGVLALQACGTDVGAHKKKMEEPELSQTVAKWLGAGNRILIVAWREVWQQTSERHKLKKWTPRFLSCSIDDRSISFHGEVPLRWTEHEAWPIPLSGGVAMQNK